MSLLRSQLEAQSHLLNEENFADDVGCIVNETELVNYKNRHGNMSRRMCCTQVLFGVIQLICATLWIFVDLCGMFFVASQKLGGEAKWFLHRNLSGRSPHQHHWGMPWFMGVASCCCKEWDEFCFELWTWRMATRILCMQIMPFFTCDDILEFDHGHSST